MIKRKFIIILNFSFIFIILNTCKKRTNNKEINEEKVISPNHIFNIDKNRSLKNINNTIFLSRKSGTSDSDIPWIELKKKHPNKIKLYKCNPINKNGSCYSMSIYNKKNIKFFNTEEDTLSSGLLSETKESKPGYFNVIQFNNSTKNISSKKEITVILIHGSGGYQIIFEDLIKGLIGRKFKGKLNFIIGKRFNSNNVCFNDQTEEITKQLYEFLKHNKKTDTPHNVVLVGISSGGILASKILNKYINDTKIKIVGLVFASSGFGGINCIEAFLNKLETNAPHFVKKLEKMVFNCQFKDDPPGIEAIRKKNILPILKEANDNILNYKIPVLNFKGMKPCNSEYESIHNLRNIIKIIIKGLTKKKPCINEKKHNTKDISQQLEDLRIIFEELTILLKMKFENNNSPFHSKEITGSKYNDLIFSVKDQMWPYKNPYLKEILLRNIIHTKYIMDVVYTSEEDNAHCIFEDITFHKMVTNFLNKRFDEIS